MTLYRSDSPCAPFIPPRDDLTIPQVIIDDKLNHVVRNKSDREYPCFIEEATGRTIWKEELRERTNKLAVIFKEKWALKKGDIVSLFSPNHVDYAVAIWAAHRLGCTVAAVPATSTPEEFVYLHGIVEPSFIIAHTLNLHVALAASNTTKFPQTHIITIDADVVTAVPSVPSLLAEIKVNPASYVDIKLNKGEAKTLIAFLCFSSGTTGKPKAVAVSHYNVIASIILGAMTLRTFEEDTPWDERRYREGDIVAGILPYSHIYGLVVNLHHMIYGKIITVVFPKFDFIGMLQSIAKYRITQLIIVPPMALLICKHPASLTADLSSIRTCMIGGSPASAELCAQLQQRLPGVEFGGAYGLTETCAGVSVWPVTQKVGTPGSVGHVFSGATMKVVKQDGSLANYGEEGELWVTSPQVGLGYYRNEEATKETFIDGWVRTGDIAYFEPNGDLFIVDRAKELIKVKGFQVAPAELEGHLLSHPDIADAGVIGVPDTYSGERPMAFIVLKEKYADIKKEPRGPVAEMLRKDIFNHVAKSKSDYKWITGGIVFVDDLPKNPSGKLLRRVLKEQVKALGVPATAKL